MAPLSSALEKEFRRLDTLKIMIMAKARSLSVEEYGYQTNPNSWSAGQIVNHLYLSEKLSLAYVKKKLQYPDTVPEFSIRSWWSVFRYRFLFAAARMKAPRQINMWDGQEVLSVDELNRKWEDLRSELRSFILENYPRFPTHLVFRHPFSGRMTFRQMLGFFGDHIIHHMRQMDRVLHKMESRSKRV